ncbi:MAG: isocitrate lyase/PEP mutase family protein [Cyanobacteriota bacterium]
MVKKSTVLKNKINERRALVVPGCHDAFSAKIIEEAGFEAIQVSGYGLAGCLYGKPDVGLVHMGDILNSTWHIAKSVDIPIMADIDTGGGNAVNVMWLVERLIDIGVGGFNIEDQYFPKRCGHMKGKEVISAEEMAGKIRAAAKVRNELDPDLVINARTDCFALMGLDEAIRRSNMYLEAGADLAFIDGIKTKADVERAVKEVDGPISVNLMDAVSGMKTELIPIPELARMGVGRVSIPVASIMVVHRALKDYFKALKESPTGILEGQTHWLTTFKEYTDFVGLSEYKDLENKYLPENKLAEKYGKEVQAAQIVT